MLIKREYFMKILSKFIILIMSSLVLIGCSTFFNTTTQEIELNSNPPNAKISVDGISFGTTPQVINIERGVNHSVKFELDGFEPYETQITRQMSNWFWFNALNIRKKKAESKQNCFAGFDKFSKREMMRKVTGL